MSLQPRPESASWFSRAVRHCAAPDGRKARNACRREQVRRAGSRWRKRRGRKPVAGTVARRRSLSSRRRPRVGARRSTSAARARVRRRHQRHRLRSAAALRNRSAGQIRSCSTRARAAARAADDRDAGDVADGRRSGVQHSADDVVNVRHRLQPHAEVGGALEDDYDVEHHAVREPHRPAAARPARLAALFGFTQSPNGNFAFNFTIASRPSRTSSSTTTARRFARARSDRVARVRCARHPQSLELSVRPVDIPAMTNEVVIDGNSLTIEQVPAVARDRARVSLAPHARQRAARPARSSIASSRAAPSPTA